MKILISIDNYFAHYYIRLAIARVLTIMGHQVVLWDINKKPVYDAFDELEPDLFIGQTFNITKPIIECLAERPHCKVIMKASDYGAVSSMIDRDKYPVLIANEKEIDMVKELQEKTGKPNFVYVHYMKERMHGTHNYWKDNLGINYFSLMNAADITQYTNGTPKPEYDCDFCFVGGRWGYKSRTFDKWLIPLLSRDKNYRVKIFGNQAWGVSQYCGFLPEEEVKHLFSSAKVCPNLSEPHSQDLGYDVIERPFKLLAAKACVLSDYVEDLYKLFPDGEIHFAKTPEEFVDKLDVLLSDQKLRVESAMAGYENVLKHHTYFHRVRDIMLELGMEDQAIICMDKLQEIKERLNL